jgi:hypothetical protein
VIYWIGLTAVATMAAAGLAGSVILLLRLAAIRFDLGLPRFVARER